MKSRVVERIPELTLSIGMIVKNEEKNLPGCLNALRPLLDNIPSELIITDTGSTDKTADIAREFTDKVYGFEWVDDFAAARNFGLQKCVGEWFMFLDADEVFDGDMSEMIEFFTNRRLRKGYNSATHLRKDYTNADKTTWNMSAESRLVRLQNGIKFVNPIHECFNHFYGPTYEFKTFSEHTGYIYETKEQEEAKRRRNLIPLMKQYEKNPNDLRIMISLFKEMSDGEKADFIPKILSSAKGQKGNSAFAEAAFLTAARHSYEADDLAAVIKTADAYLDIYKAASIVALDMYVMKGSALIKSGETGEGIKCYEAYFRCYERYLSGKLNAAPQRTVSVIFADRAHYEGIKGHYKQLTGNS